MSTEDQHLGPEAQRASIEAWATREGVTVAHGSEDRIRGGAELNARGQLTDAMDAIVRHRAAKRRQGMRAGTVPWGYRADREGRLVVNAAEASVTTRAKELRSAGVSLAKIAEQLTEEGHRGRLGSGFAVNQVVRMLATDAAAD